MSNNYVSYLSSLVTSKRKRIQRSLKPTIFTVLFSSFFLCSNISTALAHAVQVCYAVLPSGFIRVYIEHWHGDQSIETLNHNGMDITTTMGNITITQQLNPVGAANNTPWDKLPADGAGIVVLKKGASANLYQDWAYYDFAPALCNVPVNIRLNGGVSVVLSQESNDFWPQTISGTFKDTSAPTISLSNTTATALCGTAGATVNFLATAVDNCSSNPTVTYSVEPGSFFPIGTTVVTASCTDEKGNKSQLTFPVIVTGIDQEPPTIVSPASMVINSEPGKCGAKVIYQVTATDGCSEAIITQVKGLPSGSVFPSGTTTNTFKATDASGNVSIKSFDVTVKDIDAPIVPALADITASCSANISTAPVATDLCEGPVKGTTTDPLNYSKQGTYLITWTFKDSKGNSSSAIQKVIIKDTEKPVVPVLPNIIAVCSATAPIPEAFDCSGTIKGVTKDPRSYSSPGVHPITWIFRDENGNTSSAKQYVIINDVIAPVASTRDLVLQLDQNGRATITEDEVNNGSYDNCKISSYTLDKKFFDISNTGINTVNLTVTDANGNVSTKSATVTILNKASVLSAYPNPFSSESTISFTLIGDVATASLDLYDSKGIKIQNLYTGPYRANSTYSTHLEGSHLRGGYYFLRLTTNREALNFKLIVEK